MTTSRPAPRRLPSFEQHAIGLADSGGHAEQDAIASPHGAIVRRSGAEEVVDEEVDQLDS